MSHPNDPINPISSQNYNRIGLTKREHYAGLIMQGLASSPSEYSLEVQTLFAVRAADLLLDALSIQPEHIQEHLMQSIRKNMK